MFEGYCIQEQSGSPQSQTNIKNINNTCGTVSSSFKLLCFLMLFIQIQAQVENQEDPGIDLEEPCLITPYNFVTKCNITCEYCDSENDDHGECLSCPQYLRLVDGSCQEPVGQEYEYREYFMKERIIDEDEGELQLFRDQQGNLNESDVTKICIANKYRFEMLGPFENEVEIQHSESFPYEIEYMAVNFRVFFLNENSTILVKVRNEVVHTQTILSGKSMPDDFIELENSTYLNIVNDPSDYIDKLFVPVKTGLFEASGFNFKIEITVTSEDDNTTNKWLLNQFNVIGVKCGTCISAQVETLRNVLGIIIGVSILCILIILCVIGIYLKLESRNRSLRKRTEFQKKISAFKKKYGKQKNQTTNLFKTQNRIDTQNKLIGKKSQ